MVCELDVDCQGSSQKKNKRGVVLRAYLLGLKIFCLRKGFHPLSQIVIVFIVVIVVSFSRCSPP